MQNNNDIIIPILSSIAAYFVSADVAKPLGQILGVFLAGSAGAAFYIGRKEKVTALKAVGIYLLLVGVALTIALPLVELIQLALTHAGVNVHLPKSVGMPVAFIITAFPQHIMDVLLRLKEKWNGKPDKLD